MINQMIRFVAKDFIILKGSLKTSVLMGMIMAIFFYISNSNPAIIISVVAFPIIYGFVNKALYEDEKNNTLRYLVSLPLKREVIVYSRYLSVGLMIIVVTLAMFGIERLLTAAGLWKTDVEMNGLVIVSILCVFIVILSIYLPIAFKLGYIKAVSINRFLFIGIFAIFGALGVAANKLFKGEPPEFISRTKEFLSALNAGVVAIIFVIIVFAIYIISLRVSVSFFRRRDLFK